MQKKKTCDFDGNCIESIDHYQEVILELTLKVPKHPPREIKYKYSDNCSMKFSLIQYFIYSSMHRVSILTSRKQISRLYFIVSFPLISHVLYPKPHTASSDSYKGIFTHILIGMKLTFVLLQQQQLESHSLK